MWICTRGANLSALISYFEAVPHQTPPWLEEMIGYSTWRNMIYQLAEQFPDCLLLKFAIKVSTSNVYCACLYSRYDSCVQFVVSTILVCVCAVDVFFMSSVNVQVYKYICIVHMYVHTYVHMYVLCAMYYVCTYVCMYVCIYASVCVSTYVLSYAHVNLYHIGHCVTV